jgi:hypothetical protein
VPLRPSDQAENVCLSTCAVSGTKLRRDAGAHGASHLAVHEISLQGDASQHAGAAHRDGIGIVGKVQRDHRCSPDWCGTDDPQPVVGPAEVLGPALRPWVELRR